MAARSPPPSAATPCPRSATRCRHTAGWIAWGGRAVETDRPPRALPASSTFGHNRDARPRGGRVAWGACRGRDGGIVKAQQLADLRAQLRERGLDALLIT